MSKQPMNSRDRRKSGEGAMKGWATRRQRAAARKAALLEVMDEIGITCVHGIRVSDHPGKFLVGASTLIGWRDRIAKSIAKLEGVPQR